MSTVCRGATEPSSAGAQAAGTPDRLSSIKQEGVLPLPMGIQSRNSVPVCSEISSYACLKHSAAALEVVVDDMLQCRGSGPEPLHDKTRPKAHMRSQEGGVSP